MTIPFLLTGIEGQSYQTIDLSQCASLVNRRFYRQGLEWAVAGFSFASDDGATGTISIQKIQDTWCTDNAYTKAYHAWKKQQDEAVDDAGAESAVARYRDFKIFMDFRHLTNVFTDNLLPIGYGGGGFPVGEWEASTIVIPNFGAPGVNYEPYLMMHGDDVGGVGGAKGLVKGYENSRAYPHSPDPVSPDIGSNENWLQSMFDLGDNFEDVLDNATDRNDNLPYDQDSYPGGDVVAPQPALHHNTFLTSTTIGGMTSAPGTNFKCGLIRISHDIANGKNVFMSVHLVPGDHRGYLAERMT